MSMIYCDYCSKMIDTDYNAEHFMTEGRFTAEEQHIIDFANKEGFADLEDACYQEKKDYIKECQAMAAEDFNCHADY